MEGFLVKWKEVPRDINPSKKEEQAYEDELSLGRGKEVLNENEG